VVIAIGHPFAYIRALHQSFGSFDVQQDTSKTFQSMPMPVCKLSLGLNQVIEATLSVNP
jgi:hypothetical protein